MGLMLSVLVMCVGVLEAISCLQHIRHSVLPVDIKRKKRRMFIDLGTGAVRHADINWPGDVPRDSHVIRRRSSFELEDNICGRRLSGFDYGQVEHTVSSILVEEEPSTDETLSDEITEIFSGVSRIEFPTQAQPHANTATTFIPIDEAESVNESNLCLPYDQIGSPSDVFANESYRKHRGEMINSQRESIEGFTTDESPNTQVNDQVPQVHEVGVIQNVIAEGHSMSPSDVVVDTDASREIISSQGESFEAVESGGSTATQVDDVEVITTINELSLDSQSAVPEGHTLDAIVDTGAPHVEATVPQVESFKEVTDEVPQVHEVKVMPSVNESNLCPPSTAEGHIDSLSGGVVHEPSRNQQRETTSPQHESYEITSSVAQANDEACQDQEVSGSSSEDSESSESNNTISEINESAHHSSGVSGISESLQTDSSFSDPQKQDRLPEDDTFKTNIEEKVESNHEGRLFSTPTSAELDKSSGECAVDLRASPHFTDAVQDERDTNDISSNENSPFLHDSTTEKVRAFSKLMISTLCREISDDSQPPTESSAAPILNERVIPLASQTGDDVRRESPSLDSSEPKDATSCVTPISTELKADDDSILLEKPAPGHHAGVEDAALPFDENPTNAALESTPEVLEERSGFNLENEVQCEDTEYFEEDIATGKPVASLDAVTKRQPLDFVEGDQNILTSFETQQLSKSSTGSSKLKKKTVSFAEPAEVQNTSIVKHQVQSDTTTLCPPEMDLPNPIDVPEESNYDAVSGNDELSHFSEGVEPHDIDKALVTSSCDARIRTTANAPNVTSIEPRSEFKILRHSSVQDLTDSPSSVKVPSNVDGSPQSSGSPENSQTQPFPDDTFVHAVKQETNQDILDDSSSLKFDGFQVQEPTSRDLVPQITDEVEAVSIIPENLNTSVVPSSASQDLPSVSRLSEPILTEHEPKTPEPAPVVLGNFDSNESTKNTSVVENVELTKVGEFEEATVQNSDRVAGETKLDLPLEELKVEAENFQKTNNAPQTTSQTDKTVPDTSEFRAVKSSADDLTGESNREDQESPPCKQTNNAAGDVRIVSDRELCNNMTDSTTASEVKQKLKRVTSLDDGDTVTVTPTTRREPTMENVQDPGDYASPEKAFWVRD